MKKGTTTYTVKHEPTGGEITVKIDFDYESLYDGRVFTMDDWIKEMVDFWHGSAERLAENDGNYVKTFLPMLCQEALAIALEYQCGPEMVVRKFVNKEGYCPMDGSHGITITKVEQMELTDYSQYEITEEYTI